MKNITITTPTYGKFAPDALAGLRQAGYELRRVPDGEGTERGVMEAVDGETAAIIAGLEPITARVMEKAAHVAVVAKHGIGIDNIDLDAARRRGIRVVNAPNASADSVADLAFGLLCALARNIPRADGAVRSGGWPRMFGTGVRGKTLGLLGFGSIGKKMALRAGGFDMRVLACDPRFDEEFARARGVLRAEPEEILRTADYLSVHLPLLPATRDLVGERELALMKPSAFLINTSRGEIVNEEALCRALRDGSIAGAALDVFTREPPVHLDFRDLPNLIVTPHAGGYTDDALAATSRLVCGQVLRILKGESVGGPVA